MSIDKRMPNEEDHKTLRNLVETVREVEAAHYLQWNKYSSLIASPQVDKSIIEEERFITVSTFEAFVDAITAVEAYYIMNGLSWMR